MSIVHLLLIVVMAVIGKRMKEFFANIGVLMLVSVVDANATPPKELDHTVVSTKYKIYENVENIIEETSQQVEIKRIISAGCRRNFYKLMLLKNKLQTQDDGMNALLNKRIKTLKRGIAVKSSFYLGVMQGYQIDITQKTNNLLLSFLGNANIDEKFLRNKIIDTVALEQERGRINSLITEATALLNLAQIKPMDVLSIKDDYSVYIYSSMYNLPEINQNLIRNNFDILLLNPIRRYYNGLNEILNDIPRREQILAPLLNVINVLMEANSTVYDDVFTKKFRDGLKGVISKVCCFDGNKVNLVGCLFGAFSHVTNRDLLFQSYCLFGGIPRNMMNSGSYKAICNEMISDLKSKNSFYGLFKFFELYSTRQDKSAATLDEIEHKVLSVFNFPDVDVLNFISMLLPNNYTYYKELSDIAKATEIPGANNPFMSFFNAYHLEYSEKHCINLSSDSLKTMIFGLHIRTFAYLYETGNREKAVRNFDYSKVVSIFTSGYQWALELDTNRLGLTITDISRANDLAKRIIPLCDKKQKLFYICLLCNYVMGMPKTQWVTDISSDFYSDFIKVDFCFRMGGW